VNNSFKTRLKNGELLIGSLVSIPSTDVAEIMSHIGFDYLWIEMEHAPMDFVHAQMMVQAVGGRCPCLVRIPENKEVWIKKALDIGFDGIVVPQVKSAAEARQTVEWSLYPPAGRRGVGVSRAHTYGVAFEEYVDSVNDDLTIVLQVEHIEGVQNIESIAGVPGVDAILVGPFDLSGSLDLLGQIGHPKVQEAIDRVSQHCQAVDMPLGIFAVDAAYARDAIAKGFNLIALSLDTSFLWQSAQATLAQARGEGT
jgi:2-dehydro-3-deoxyglucarate aldolase/4-hydroxy-2-oxoheptanedioate aldolase